MPRSRLRDRCGGDGSRIWKKRDRRSECRVLWGVGGGCHDDGGFGGLGEGAMCGRDGTMRGSKVSRTSTGEAPSAR